MRPAARRSASPDTSPIRPPDCLSARARGDGVHRATRHHRRRELLGEIAGRILCTVTVLDEQPLWPARSLHAYEHPCALQALAVQHDLEISLFVASTQRLHAAAVL